jgi:hypothetical protein
VKGRTGRRGRKGTAARIAVQIVFVSFVSLVSSVPFVSAQTVTQRGFVEGSVFLFPQEALNDPTRVVGDLLAREDLFVKPAPWIQFAAGLDLRANSHDQVDGRWRLDLDDRGVKRPLAPLRRLNATLSHGPLTVDVGKQFIRWGKADIINPTDRFAPRDYINVVSPEFLAVTGVRAVASHGADTFEGVWVPRLTPSRVPLIDQRWTVLPPEATGVPIVDGGSVFPTGSQAGVRWGHAGSGYEYSLSFFNGFNNLPNIRASTTLNAEPAEVAEKICSACSASSAFIEIRREYPAIRTYGADAALPTKWFTLKGEAAYFTSSTPMTDEYVLYVVQVERQTGEWLIVAGYSGDATTKRRAAFGFAPDRGLARSIVARASYTIDPVRSVAFETAIHQNGHGAFAKVEYSQASGPHWRATFSGVGIAGQDDDFLGQYHRNSHFSVALRYSF